MKTNKWLILVAVAIPMLMIEMAGTSVFVAFQTIASDLNVSIDRSVWLSTLYLMANAVMIPLAGWLGKRFGYKRVIISSVVLFGISAMLGGLARNFDFLVFTQAVQGLGDGPIMPLAYALLLEIFPANQRGKMTVGLMLAIGIAPALGPFIAAGIVEEIGWRGIFFMNVILSLISVIAVTALLPSMKPVSEKVKVNWLVFFLLAIGTVSLQLFLDRGQHLNWFESEFILGLFIAAVVSVTLYLLVTFATKDSSVLNLRLLKNIPFLMGNIANMSLMGLLMGAILVKVFYLEWLMGFTPTYSANYQAILAVAMFLFSAVAGVLTDRINPRWPVILGLPIMVYSLFLSSRLSLYSGMESILTIGVIMGVGIAFSITPIMVTVFASISREDMGEASVLNSYLSVIGSSISISLVTFFLMYRIDVNTFYLASAMNLDNPAIAQAIHTTGTDVAIQAAYAQMIRRSAMVAFNDVWYLMAYITVLLIVYLPFMKRAKLE